MVVETSDNVVLTGLKVFNTGNEGVRVRFGSTNTVVQVSGKAMQQVVPLVN